VRFNSNRLVIDDFDEFLWGGPNAGFRSFKHLTKSNGFSSFLDIEPAAFEYPLTAFVRIRPMPGQLAKVSDLAKQIPQVVECHRITGEDCFILKIFLANISLLDQIPDRFLAYGQNHNIYCAILAGTSSFTSNPEEAGMNQATASK
jgi:hypothetical protein